MFDHLPHRKIGERPVVGCAYAIINTVNGRTYVGGTSTPRIRVKSHFSQLQRNVHPNKKIQSDFNEHGIGAFKIEVLETYAHDHFKIVINTVRSIERGYIKRMNPYYNISLPYGMKKQSEILTEEVNSK